MFDHRSLEFILLALAVTGMLLFSSPKDTSAADQSTIGFARMLMSK